MGGAAGFSSRAIAIAAAPSPPPFPSRRHRHHGSAGRPRAELQSSSPPTMLRGEEGRGEEVGDSEKRSTVPKAGRLSAPEEARQRLRRAAAHTAETCVRARDRVSGGLSARTRACQRRPRCARGEARAGAWAACAS